MHQGRHYLRIKFSREHAWIYLHRLTDNSLFANKYLASSLQPRDVDHFRKGQAADALDIEVSQGWIHTFSRWLRGSTTDFLFHDECGYAVIEVPMRNSFHLIQAAQSNGLFSQVGRVIGVSTNGVAPAIWSLNASAVDARTDAAQLSVTMEATGVACRVWYTVQKLRDVQHLEAETVTPEGIVNGARGDSVIDFPKVRQFNQKYNVPCNSVRRAEGYPWLCSEAAQRAKCFLHQL